MNNQNKKDVLVALLKDKEDEYYAAVEHWYRIPDKTKRCPQMVKDGSIKIIAFYLPKKFEHYYWTVPWFGEVSKISKVQRKELIKSSEVDPKAEDYYYKIEFSKLNELPTPIVSKSGRRILFITTTQNHFKHAQEINDLFYESPLEEKLWVELKKMKINAERQYQISVEKKNYFVDFALFCKIRNIAVECDGDTYHMKPERVEEDKHRDNLLYKSGWDVRRFTSTKIYEEMDSTIGMICETVNKYGGIQNVDNPRNFNYIRDMNNAQDSLFEI
jgi:very-short-patch-repair endonuclease